MSEEGFHEIQLSGKQLVFLFMATTVVAVVIFLSGVMVGRGVRAEAASETEGQLAELAPPLAGGAADVNPASPQPKIDTNTPPPQPVNDELSYYSRLEKQGTPAEKLKAADAPASAAPPPAATEKPAPAAPPAPTVKPPTPAAAKPAPAEKVSTPPAAPAPTSAGSASDASGGFAVQVAALGSKADAAQLAQRLIGKGYAAYVVTPAAGGAQVFRVRVGKFKSRQDADAAARKLEKEEKFKPWVIR